MVYGSADDARPVPSDRSGADLVPIPVPSDDDGDPPWVPTFEGKPIDLKGSVYDPEAWPAVSPAPPEPLPALARTPTGGEIQRVMPRAVPGVLVGGQAFRPVLQTPPKSARREPGLGELSPDRQSGVIVAWCYLLACVAVLFVALMVWLNVSHRM